MKQLYFKSFSILILAILSLNLQAQPTINKGQDPKPLGKHWVIVENLSDEFDGESVDTLKWKDSEYLYTYSPGNVGDRGWYGSKRSLFQFENATVENGKLYIEAEMFDEPKYSPQDNQTQPAVRKYGGAFVSSKELAQPGYYIEAKMQASTTVMSSAFWLATPPIPCDELPYNGEKLELDIQECVGRVTGSKFDDWTKDDWSHGEKPWDRIFHYNTHRHNTWNCYQGSQQTAGGSIAMEDNSADFHIYAAYWRTDGNVDFFLDGELIKSVKPPIPFLGSQQLIMSSNFYDWIKETTAEDMGFNDSREDRSTKFEWVRTWKLEDAPVENDSVVINSVPEKVKSGFSFDVSAIYTSIEKSDIVAIVEDPNGNFLTQTTQTVDSGVGTITLTLNQDTAWNIADNYIVKIVLRNVGDTVTNKIITSTTFNISAPFDESISIVNIPETVESGKSFVFKVAYSTATENEIVAIAYSPTGQWLTNSIRTVNTGEGEVSLSLSQENAWSVNKDYKLTIAIRPKGSGLGESFEIKETTFDVIPEVLSVVRVRLEPSSLTIAKGDTSTIKATIFPINAANQNVNWTTDNENVTINNSGLITAVSEGNTVITVTTEDRGRTAKCNVTVVASTTNLFSPKKDNPNKISVFPNPVIGNEFKLIIDMDKSEKTVLKIFQITGRLIYEKDLGVLQNNKNEFLLNASNINILNTGIYILQVQSKTSLQSVKIVRK